MSVLVVMKLALPLEDTLTVRPPHWKIVLQCSVSNLITLPIVTFTLQRNCLQRDVYGKLLRPPIATETFVYVFGVFVVELRSSQLYGIINVIHWQSSTASGPSMVRSPSGIDRARALCMLRSLMILTGRAIAPHWNDMHTAQ